MNDLLPTLKGGAMVELAVTRGLNAEIPDDWASPRVSIYEPLPPTFVPEEFMDLLHPSKQDLFEISL